VSKATKERRRSNVQQEGQRKQRQGCNNILPGQGVAVQHDDDDDKNIVGRM
jgi:hypothetical protein